MPEDDQPQPNGDRMDRFERGLERLLSVQAEHQTRLDRIEREAERTQSQIREQGENIHGLIDVAQAHQASLERLIVFSEETAQRFRDSAVRSRETDERLNALIKIVDEVVRKQPPPPA